jgi:hypothetical protein
MLAPSPDNLPTVPSIFTVCDAVTRRIIGMCLKLISRQIRYVKSRRARSENLCSLGWSKPCCSLCIFCLSTSVIRVSWNARVHPERLCCLSACVSHVSWNARVHPRGTLLFSLDVADVTFQSSFPAHSQSDNCVICACLYERAFARLRIS